MCDTSEFDEVKCHSLPGNTSLIALSSAAHLSVIHQRGFHSGHHDFNIRNASDSCVHVSSWITKLAQTYQKNMIFKSQNSL